MTRRLTLFKYLISPPVDFNGWSINEVAERASKDLKFDIDPRNIKALIRNGQINIKFKKNSEGHSPMSVLTTKVKMLQDGYLHLCNLLDVDAPDEIKNMFPNDE